VTESIWTWPLSDTEWSAIKLSLKVSLWAIVAGLPLAVVFAWVLATKEFWGKNIVNGIVHLPLVLPPVVCGYILLITMGNNGLIGKPLNDYFGLNFVFSWRGAAIAAAVMAFPLMVRAIRLSFEGIDRKLPEAARTLGARPVKVFFTVTLPLISPGIIAGLILAYARSLGEFGATITFVSNIPGETRTLPIAIYTYTQMPNGDAPAARLVIVAVCLAMVALIGSEILSRRLQKVLHG
jgi:molybdate transport system permease protein